MDGRHETKNSFIDHDKKNASVKWSEMHNPENDISANRNSSLIEFDFTAKREAAGTITPIRKGKYNKHLGVP